MAWTYSGNPGASPKDEVRFLLGDTTNTPQSLSDEEITYLLGQAVSPLGAAAEAALAMGARYSGLSATSKKVGDLSLSVDYGATAARFTALAAALTKRASTRTFLPVASDQTLAAGVFSIGMDDWAEE